MRVWRSHLAVTSPRPEVDGANVASGLYGAERPLILLVSVLVITAISLLYQGETKSTVVVELLGRWSGLVIWPAIVMAGIVGSSTIWHVVLWLSYRPTKALDVGDQRLPSITVVIPAYNEGKTVLDCIDSVISQDFPRHLLRVIAVDDGSLDDTWDYMQAGRRLDPDRVRLIGMDENRGKRHALYQAYHSAQSEIVVTVDSDTILEPGALRAIVAPIVTEPDVGAVAGRIEVLNRDRNLLTRMLGVRYRIGFDFVRAYQSVLKGVFICPGAFTAWRMSAIRGHLDAWRSQEFFGAACTNGDDHAMTNIVLRQGMKTVYQGNAVARTTVPATYIGLTRMYLRWARSNVRESLLFVRFAPRLVLVRGRQLAVMDALVHLTLIPLRLYLVLLGYGLMVMAPGLILRSLLAVLLAATVQMAIYLRSERSFDAVYAMAYAGFALLTLQWIYPVAALTVRRARWLTR